MAVSLNCILYLVILTTSSLVQFSRAVVLLNPPGPLSSLHSIYFNTLTANSLQDLERCVPLLLLLLYTQPLSNLFPPWLICSQYYQHCVNCSIFFYQRDL